MIYIYTKPCMHKFMQLHLQLTNSPNLGLGFASESTLCAVESVLEPPALRKHSRTVLLSDRVTCSTVKSVPVSVTSEVILLPVRAASMSFINNVKSRRVSPGLTLQFTNKSSPSFCIRYSERIRTAPHMNNRNQNGRNSKLMVKVRTGLGRLFCSS